MQQAVFGSRTGSRWEVSSFGHCLAVALGCCIASAPALSQDAAVSEAVAAEASRTEPMRLEVNTSTLPRLDSQENGFQAPRVDLSVLPPGGQGVGVAVGMAGFAPRSGLQSALQPVRPSVDLGVHWRHTLEGKQIDVTAWRRMQQQQDAYALVQQRQPLYGARVEMKLAPSRQQGFLFEQGFVGLQLQGDARISIKRKDGRPMVYYRTKF
jgi:hypothetical protein